MKLLRPVLNDEYFLDDTTKCLYTAVVVMTLYLGKYSLNHVKTCDVDYVKKLYKEMRDTALQSNPKSTFDLSPMLARECYKALLTPAKTSRYLFYIMMTNAEVPLSTDIEGSTIQFPGHVCVIERYPSGRYYVYQSYINHYDINGHYERNDMSFAISKKNLEYIFTQVQELYKNGLWTPETTRAYSMLTHLESKEFEDRVFKDRSCFCYRMVPIKTCTSRLNGIIKAALKPSNTNFDASTKRQLIELRDIIIKNMRKK